MGMFDYFRCEAPLPGPKPNKAFQTKDLGCDLGVHTLTAEGLLMEDVLVEVQEVPQAERPFPDAPDDDLRSIVGSVRSIREKRLSCFTGVVNFYGQMEGGGTWVSYLAFLYRGRLVAPVLFAPDHDDPFYQSSGAQSQSSELEAMAALMRARLTEAPIPGAPELGSVWRHHSGRLYTVILIANQPDNDRYPVTVVYQGENGKVWARPASDWDRSMTRMSGEGA